MTDQNQVIRACRCMLADLQAHAQANGTLCCPTCELSETMKHEPKPKPDLCFDPAGEYSPWRATW